MKAENIVNIKYEQTGQSTHTNELGMREMQAKVYDCKDKQYLLLKAPPASGKSRAMMFVALYKMQHQGIRKTIVSVPEKTIGGSFQNTKLKEFGFFADWTVAPYYNLCGGIMKQIKLVGLKSFCKTMQQGFLCVHIPHFVTLSRIWMMSVSTIY